MSTRTLPKVGVIVCSQRVPRVGLQISEFVFSTIQQTSPSVSLKLIDLSTWDLPLFNEPGIPSQINSPDQYVHSHTRRWSAEISSYSAFVFVTPQYNWGYPASVKNAIDYLFNEWKGKPAMIVSYGGRGGSKAAGQLKEVLQGVRMQPVEKIVTLAFPGRDVLAKASKGEDLGLNIETEQKIWSKESDELVEAFQELVGLLVN